ncbi:YdeI/OmpD-associated family protein [Thalassolituus sp. LLYu03]|uniref:YdeI/OmpD-associated family protein n=1 Tax=Thalassolituus sp. LLYu03 TaxID=3421656 RepID=UPI003D272F54
MSATHLSAHLSFATSNDLDQWLALNHGSERELWVRIFKKGSGIASVTWEEMVIESLCWGWIDGLRKSLDNESYIQRITPRQARSVWSKKNREHVERLISEGRMKAPGLVHVHAAQADGRWENAYVASEMTVPEDFLAALEKVPDARRFYDTLTKSNRYVIAYGLSSAKKTETRQKRFEKYMGSLVKQEKPV